MARRFPARIVLGDAFPDAGDPMHSMYRGEDEMLAVLDTLALSDDPLFVVDDHNRIVFWNRAVQDLLGYSHDEMAGRACAVLAGDDHFGNRYCSDACPVHQLARRGDTIRQFRLRFASRGGPVIQLDVNVIKFTLRRSRRTLLAHFMRKPTIVEEDVATPPHKVATREHMDARIRRLTQREVEILGLLAAGRHTREIASQLGIAPLTTRNHIQNIFTKIEVHSQSEAVAFAFKMHLA